MTATSAPRRTASLSSVGAGRTRAVLPVRPATAGDLERSGVALLVGGITVAALAGRVHATSLVHPPVGHVDARPCGGEAG